jgi:hypothetical protein
MITDLLVHSGHHLDELVILNESVTVLVHLLYQIRPGLIIQVT